MEKKTITTQPKSSNPYIYIYISEVKQFNAKYLIDFDDESFIFMEKQHNFERNIERKEEEDPYFIFLPIPPPPLALLK